MSKKCILFILLIFSIINTLLSQDLNLMPLPNSVNLGNDKFIINSSLKILLTNNSSKKLNDYSKEVLRRISNKTGIFLDKEVITTNTDELTGKIVISYEKSENIKLGIDESYTIKILNNKINIDAKSDIGIMHALETLYQLVLNDSFQYYFPTIEIKDSPRFKWRGLMIDVSRHFMPVDVIKRNINAMAMVKMNVLHLHLSDNQSVRVESKIFPEIQEKCSNGEYFTQSQLLDIIQYANNRGIRVIPEFDIPWHSTAWFAAFPELASKNEKYEPEISWGVFDPVFNPTIEKTYEFFDKFIGEMASIFNDEYFHIGGDEGTDKYWSENEQIKDFMQHNNMDDIKTLHNYFNLRILKILEKYNKKMIGWDEIFQPDMPNTIVIQSWRGQKSLIDFAEKGYLGILSNGYYIDLIQPTDYHYLNNPIPDSISISDEAREKVLGGEATMWSELVTSENIDSRIWPRTAAIAERFWSKSSINDVNDMYKRIDFINNLLENVGAAHIKNIDMMIRRLCNYNDTTPLKTLLEVIEPLKEYSRHSRGVKYTTYSPYTRVVDVAIPDVKKGRELKNLLKEFSKTSKKEVGTILKSEINRYVLNYEPCKKLINKSPILAEILPLVNNLHKLCEITIKIIDLKESNTKINKYDFTEYSKIINDSKQSFGQVEIVFINEVESLLNSL